MKNKKYRIFNWNNWRTSFFFDSLEQMLKQPINAECERYEKFEQNTISNGVISSGYNPINIQ